MAYDNPKHPIWEIVKATLPIAKLGLLMLALVVILYFNAKDFDNTELNTLLIYFFSALGIEGGSSLVGRFFKS